MTHTLKRFDFEGTCSGCGANSSALDVAGLCRSCAAGDFPDDAPWDSPPEEEASEARR